MERERPGLGRSKCRLMRAVRLLDRLRGRSSRGPGEISSSVGCVDPDDGGGAESDRLSKLRIVALSRSFLGGRKLGEPGALDIST
jgi:hypothetical protein